MTYEIHFTTPLGEEDFVLVSGETVEEVRQRAEHAVELRGGSAAWSREIGE